MNAGKRITISAAVLAAAVVGVTGCTSTKAGSEATATVTTTTTASPSASASTTPSAGSTPTAGGSDGSGGSGGGSASTRCTAAELTASIDAGTGGAAGSDDVTLTLTNTGSASCTLQGWPGVSFVGGGNGTQIGAAARFDRSTAHGTLTLQPGAAARSDLLVAQAANYDPTACGPTPAEGFRVYPPGSTESLFASDTGFTACSSTGVSLLTVGALH